VPLSRDESSIEGVGREVGWVGLAMRYTRSVAREGSHSEVVFVGFFPSVQVCTDELNVGSSSVLALEDG
jgi:hypothetical protein